MKYLSLVWAGMWRRPIRSILTLLSVTTAFLLFGMLQGINSGYRSVIEAQRLDRLVTDPRVPGGAPMPVAALAKIKALPDVTRACGRSVMLGQYQNRRGTIVAVATNVDDFFAVRPEYRISIEQLKKLRTTRTGMAMPVNIATQLGLELGDKVPIQSAVPQRNGSTTWEFDLVALFDDIDNPGKAIFTLINYDYFDNARVGQIATVDRIITRISDPTRSTLVATQIDALFANSSHETRTQNEKEMSEFSIQQLGDIAFFTNAVIGSVFFALLFVTGNTMMQSVRERYAEFAVLRTIGFSDGTVFLLILFESLLFTLAASTVGLLLAAVLFPLIKDTVDIPNFPWIVIAAGVATATAMAVLSTLAPAWRLLRMNIVEALR